MKIGLIDVDGHNFPNIPLMKLSAWHKKRGDQVEWYKPLITGHVDVAYVAKVFSFSEDYEYPIDADKIVKGGTGYCIQNNGGRELYIDKCESLPDEIEHIYPDYALYGIQDKAYGFLSRGCPRQCSFCHVKSKEGTKSYKVADLTEFWKGQKHIQICDPNILACPDANDLLEQLAGSRSVVDLNQGIDARLLTDKNVEIIKRIRIKYYHFALDQSKDESKIVPKLKMFVDIVKPYKKNVIVYCLVNYDSTLEEDFHRIYTLLDIGVSPYVMIYDKEHCDPIYKRMQRWVNAPQIFWGTPRFEEYL